MHVARESVSELQGLYGPFTFPEKLLQRIWFRGDFDPSRATTLDGRRVEILHPGRWNQLGGPDFKQARLMLGERLVLGDVEVHLRAEDWCAHGHAADPQYDQVVLHVVLFPCENVMTRGAAGREIPVLVLLPLLLYALEDYAEDAAVERLADRAVTRAWEELAVLSVEERRTLLQQHARQRWAQKVQHAKIRTNRLGWDDACHHTALEILGYRFNRSPMQRVAGRWPLSAWVEGSVVLETVLAEESGRWSLQGVRPANRPRTRLYQYAQWVTAIPDWPSRWSSADWLSDDLDGAENTESLGETTRDFRADFQLTSLRDRMATDLIGHRALSGPRLDTLICDGLFPLRASRMEVSEIAPIWFHWFPGDVPPHLVKTLRKLDLISRVQPLSHGMMQGLLGWWIEHEKSAAKKTPVSLSLNRSGA